MKEKRILVTTKDNRKFLTYEKNLVSLIEFAKTFKANIDLVKVDKGTKSLELKKLTSAICNPKENECPEYSLIKSIYPEFKKDRKKILSKSKNIKDFIEKRFLSGKNVCLKDIKTKYQKENLTDSCLCSHMSSVRKKLTQEGHEFEKISAGNYKIIK